MKNKNLILAGVGGQGLVLTTQIISQAAFLSGLDVKTNDVIGLSQRGGTIWGSVKMGEKIHSPNIAPGDADILIAFEKLESKRWKHMLKQKDSIAIINEYEIAPTLVQQGDKEYTEDVLENMKQKSEVISLDATATGAKMGNPAIANILLLGIAARYMDISVETWFKTFEQYLPAKFVELNKKAFMYGYEQEYLK